MQLNKSLVADSFGRCAGTYDSVAVFQRTVADELIERLAVIKLEPKRILDLGSGTGYSAKLLAKQYPNAEIVLCDIALGMLQHSRVAEQIEKAVHVCGDGESLPFVDSSFDLVTSSLTLHWLPQLPQAMKDLHRVLKPEGLLMFSMLGLDTLSELRASFALLDHHQHVNHFWDMHDVGDMVLAAGFSDPVMDRDLFALMFDEPIDLMRELKLLGARNLNPNRPKGLMTPKQLKQVAIFYERYRQPDGRVPATYEVIYGHAWGATLKQSECPSEISVPIASIVR